MTDVPYAPAVASPYGKPLPSLTMDTSLTESLRFAVPLWIHEVRNLTAGQRSARAVRCAGVVGAKGDALQFKGEGRTATAQAFNALAEGLAYAAFLPGGVVFAGLHWCVDQNHMGTDERGAERAS
jgi:hypothetical protein